ncbi:MAG: SPOR domain-containing protein [Nevskiaceae bacterium]|nr:MAG: SPOR domain-containing protein [Nevskiaceae bacterium]TAM26420.1 MAG: SPOR domain-containing protein [Nevskiaceae bacterium]
MKSRALIALSMLLVSATAVASELRVLRVDGGARSVRAEAAAPLLPGNLVLNGDTVTLTPNSRAALQLAGAGLITLARSAELQVFDSRAGTPALGRFKLLSGTARIDSRVGSGRVPLDVRLNVGSLKSRIYGAEALGANDAAGETLCLLAGAIEIQTSGAPDRRLDSPGSCLRRAPDGQVRELRLSEDQPMRLALSSSEFAGPELASSNSHPSPTPIIAPVSKPGVAPTANNSLTPVASLPVAAAPATAKAGSWTVVVLSLAKREAVESRSQALLDQGLPAATRQIEVKGQIMYRSTVGSFQSAEEARAYAKTTLATAGIQGWVSPL